MSKDNGEVKGSRTGTRKPASLDPSAIMSSIPAEILGRDDLSFAAMVLFGCIYSIALHYRKCFVSNGLLSERMRLHPRQVKRLLKSLEAAELIERRYDETCHRDAIRVTWQVGEIVIRNRAKQRGDKDVIRGGDKNVTGDISATGGVTPMSPGGGPDVTGHSVIGRPNQRENPPQPPEPGGGVDGLLDLAKTIGLRGISPEKLAKAIAEFGRAKVETALAEAKKSKATSWAYCEKCLARWRDGESQPTVPKREPPAPYHASGWKPPPPDPDALPGPDAAAEIRRMTGRIAGVKP